MLEHNTHSHRVATPLLSVQRLNGWYGAGQALHGIDFEVFPGEVVTLLGRNGAGKTTTLKAIIGLLHKRQGSVVFDGRETIAMPTRAIARLGMALCPEERAIFGSLSVQENLLLPPRIKPGGLKLEEIFAMFPRLTDRLQNAGSELSGGEQQMLALARILHTGARLLLLDEPTEGLAPVIVNQITATIRQLKERGYTILLVEQNFSFAAGVADRHYIVESGRVIDTILKEDVLRDDKKIRAYLAV